ncbi:ABC transporter permease [Nocardioides KLBMP 9356]|uniref:ABC transporter permease n=1 Tax=Nocardioides potassii TaxID=2911371 RepID=A0ABS9HAC1_9ACTN|nr:ABC transporter permease [Nocardioides potassii]MCF6378165.1 ABC transporter permease [Nocardioides potassii]
MRERAKGISIDKLGLVDEAVASLAAKRLRSVLTAAGTVLGVGVLITVVGLTSTARAQIDQRFNALSATEVTVSQVADPVTVRSLAFPPAFEQRVQQIDGVEQAGLVWQLPQETSAVSPTQVLGVSGQRDSGVGVMAVSAGALNVARARVREGKLFDPIVDRAEARVALIGSLVADRYGIHHLESSPAITVNGTSFTVIGVMDSVERHSELLNNVLVPAFTARRLWGDPRGSTSPQGWVSVERGAGQVVADQLAHAIDPAAPQRFDVTPPPDPRVLGNAVNADITRLFMLLAAVCLVVGMVGIANTTLVTVLERTGEIGLRRALGARPAHIAFQVLTEATITGLVGGAIGSLLGISVILAASLSADWTAVVPPEAILGGPVLGACAAVLAGVYPSIRAARVQPLEALRVGT